MRAGLGALIDRQADLAVCGEAGNPAEAFAQLRQSKPDLVLTDLTMPGRSGLEFIKDLLAAEPGLTVLVISMHDEAVYAERVLRAGARGYIMKEAGGENLLGGGVGFHGASCRPRRYIAEMRAAMWRMKPLISAPMNGRKISSETKIATIFGAETRVGS